MRCGVRRKFFDSKEQEEYRYPGAYDPIAQLIAVIAFLEHL